MAGSLQHLIASSSDVDRELERLLLHFEIGACAFKSRLAAEGLLPPSRGIKYGAQNMRFRELLELAEVSRNFADQACNQSTKEAFLEEAASLERRAADLGRNSDGSNQSNPTANLSGLELLQSNSRVQE